MKEIGPSGEFDKHAYAYWPLLEKLQTEQRFLEAYENIFGEKLGVSEAFKTSKPRDSDTASADAPESIEQFIDELKDKAV